MKRLLVYLLLLMGFMNGLSQSLTEVQQKTINNYILYFNEITKQVSALGPSLVQPWQQMTNPKSRSSWMPASYSCRFSLNEYYYEEAKKTISSLGGSSATFISKAEVARTVYKQLDESCKSLEIYYRLKDYEKDEFKKVDELVKTMEKQVREYGHAVDELYHESVILRDKLQPYNASSAYHKADKLMRDQLAIEKALIQIWDYNVYESVHSGWPSEKLQQHIRENTSRITTLKQGGGGTQYPASSMYKSFVEGIESMQEVMRSGVDGYTFENQKSDEHSNRVYENLINYYNNDCVSFYNNFISQSVQNGYRGIFYLSVVPLFSVRSVPKQVNLEVTPFKDAEAPQLKISPVTSSISPSVHSSLTSYILYINEGMRQINLMSQSVRNLNSSASYAHARMKSGNPVTLSYYNSKFELPVTLYQKTMDQTRALPAAYQKSLLEQLNVLNGILTELNQWNSLLLAESESKQLAKDSLKHVYSFFNRYSELIETFDSKKQRLYQDVRSIYESYTIPDPKASWRISGIGLQKLLDEDYRELVKARDYFKGLPSVSVNTDQINLFARELITNEYTNLAGIQKLGRNNGLCPYSPYEDLAEYSRRYAESLVSKRQNKTTGSRHPYSELIYQYNQNLLENYNKFAELSKVPLLKSVVQLDWFETIPPREPEQAIAKTSVAPAVPAVAQVQSVGSVQVKPSSAEVRVVETVKHDTVYINRVDTVFVGAPDANLYSMEGYAINNLVLLLDVSASMNQPDRLPLLKQSVLQLMSMMRMEDKISIITYSGKAAVALPPTSFSEKEKIKTVIEQLKSEGKTDGNAGIKLAYKVADENYIRGGNNRIILATDGEFPMGKPTYDLVRKFAGEDIFITVFNFGKTSTSVKNLQQLAEQGKGNYTLITPENAEMKLILEVKAKRAR
jgi:Mg-chelatase subunit ChlD